MRLDFGSIRVPRVADGVAPSARPTVFNQPFDAGKMSDEVCGATPQTARQRRAIPISTASFRIKPDVKS
jgi:hypothetical protein